MGRLRLPRVSDIPECIFAGPVRGIANRCSRGRGGLTALYAIAQRVGLDPIRWGGSRDISRVFSVTGNPAYLAAYLSMLIPAAAGLTLKRDLSPHKRNLLLATLALMIPALFYSGGRAGWLAVVVAGVVLVTATRRQVAELAAKAWASAAIAMVVALMLLVLPGKKGVVPFVRSRPPGTSDRVNTGSGRLLTWKLTLPLIAEKPLLGTGLDTYYLVFPRMMTAEYERKVSHETMADRAHNELLQMAVSAGIPGALSYLAVIAGVGSVFVLAYRRSLDDRKPALLGAGLGAAVYFAGLQTHFSTVDISPTFWVLLGRSLGFA